MELTQAVEQLRHQGEALLSLCAILNEDQARWQPDMDNWSVLEVMAHLLKEERLDFRRHLGTIFHNSQVIWSQIDPQQWNKEKAQSPTTLEAILLDFKSEREISLTWLNALQNPDWDATITFEWGTLSAGDLLASWLAHDLLHLRQLVNLCYLLTARKRHPFDVEYAGQW